MENLRTRIYGNINECDNNKKETNMTKKKKVTWGFTGVGILFAIVSVALYIKGECILKGLAHQKQEIVDNVQQVADSSSYFIQIFPFENIDWHEIPTYMVYQDARLRIHRNRFDNEPHTHRKKPIYKCFYKDTLGEFTIDICDTTCVKPYKCAYEIDAYYSSDTMPYKDAVFFHTSHQDYASGCLRVLDFNNIISDSILLSSSEKIIKAKDSAMYSIYDIRPFRIFYHNNDDIDVTRDVKESFDSLLNLYRGKRTTIVDDLMLYYPFIGYLITNVALSESLVINESYTLSQFESPGYIQPINRRSALKQLKILYPINAIVELGYDVKKPYYLESDLMEMIQKDSIKVSWLDSCMNYERCMFEHMIFPSWNDNYSFNHYCWEDYDKWHNELCKSMYGDSIKLLSEMFGQQTIYLDWKNWICRHEYAEKNTKNVLAQFITIRGENYDVLYVLTNERDYYISKKYGYWQTMDLYYDKYYPCIIAFGVIGGILLLIGGILFLSCKQNNKITIDKSQK